MKKIKENQVNVQKAVMQVMGEHPGKWQPVAELKRNNDLFAENIKQIDDSMVHMAADPGSIRQELSASRKKLIEQLFPVTSVLGVYAFDRGDKKMQELARVKFTGLEKMDPGALKKLTRKILGISRELMKKEPGKGKKSDTRHIQDYGLGEKHMEDIQLSLNRYVAKEEELESFLKLQGKSKKELTRCVRENNRILKKKIDRLMHLYMETESEFYREYMKARLSPVTPPVNKKTAGSKKTSVKQGTAARKKNAEKVKGEKSKKSEKSVPAREIGESAPIAPQVGPSDGTS